MLTSWKENQTRAINGLAYINSYIACNVTDKDIEAKLLKALKDIDFYIFNLEMKAK